MARRARRRMRSGRWKPKYEGCIVRGSVAGFRSSAVTITVHSLRDDPNIGTITLSPEGRGGGTELSTTSQAAPSNAMKAFEKAREEWLAQNADGAEKNLKKAVQAISRIRSGVVAARRNSGSFRSAGGAKFFFSRPWPPIRNSFYLTSSWRRWPFRREKWQEALDNTNQALQLDPAGTPQLWYYDALAKFQLGKTDEANVSATKATGHRSAAQCCRIPSNCWP